MKSAKFKIIPNQIQHIYKIDHNKNEYAKVSLKLGWDRLTLK